MNNDKLQSLITLGLDERTPANEALNALRAAAKHWQETGAREPTDDEIRRAVPRERVMDVFRAEFEKSKQSIVDSVDKMYRERLNAIEKERDKYKTRLADMQRHVKAIVAFATESSESTTTAPAAKPKTGYSPYFSDPFMDIDLAMDELRRHGRG